MSSSGIALSTACAEKSQTPQGNEVQWLLIVSLYQVTMEVCQNVDVATMYYHVGLRRLRHVPNESVVEHLTDVFAGYQRLGIFSTGTAISIVTLTSTRKTK